MESMIRTLLLGMLVAGCAYGAKAVAQHYPDKPVRIITVGSDPAMPRILAQDLSSTLGQQFYVEERAGASGTIGAEVASFVRKPDVVAAFQKLNYTARPSTPEEFGALIASETKRWEDVARRAGIKPE